MTDMMWEDTDVGPFIETAEYRGFALYAGSDPDERPWWSVEESMWTREYGNETREVASGPAETTEAAKLAARAWVDEAHVAIEAMERLIDEAQAGIAAEEASGLYDQEAT